MRGKHLVQSMVGIQRALAAMLAVQACGGESAAKSVTSLAQCRRNSDCNDPLVCALGACRPKCTTSADCGGGSCITDGERAVCQPLAEKNKACSLQSECTAPLACATDYRCRNLCAYDGECNVYGIMGRVCAEDASGVRFCAEPLETRAGLLTAEPPSDAPSTPVERLESAPMLSEGPSIATLIGPEGGAVGIRAVVLTIPAGVLGEAVEVRVTELAGGPEDALGSGYQLEPPTLTFSEPATLTFDYASVDVADAAALSLCRVADDGCRALSEVSQDENKRRVVAQVDSLGTFALIAVSPVQDAGPLGEDAGVDAGTRGGFDASTSGALDASSSPADAN